MERTVPKNKPVNVIRDNKKRTRSTNVSGDKNVTKKEAENILKYKSFTIVIQSM
jgi:hypothetical protein